MASSQSAIVAKIYRADGSTLEVSDWVQQWQCTQSVSGIATWSLALPLSLGGRPLLEQCQIGDLLEVGFYAERAGRVEYFTRMVGEIQVADQQQAITANALQQVAVLSGPSLAGWLSSETVDYYLNAVISQEAKRALGAAGVDNGFQSAVALKRLDEALSAYLERVIFRILGVRRPQGGVKELLGYAFKTLDGTGEYYQSWAAFRGAAWGLLDTYADQPLHELFALTLPRARLQTLTADGGWQRNPAREWGEDRATPVVILRPAPFPYALPGGGGHLGDWPRLPLHDLRDGLNAVSVRQDARDNLNTFAIYPSTFVTDQTALRVFAPTVINLEKYRRFGYRPLSYPTQLWGYNGQGEQVDAYFNALNWRVAGQNNRLDEMFSAGLNLGFSPWIYPGERVRFWAHLPDGPSALEGYVQGVTDTWGVEARTTRLEVVRALPLSRYTSADFFAHGLQAFAPPGTNPDSGRGRNPINPAPLPPKGSQ